MRTPLRVTCCVLLLGLGGAGRAESSGLLDLSGPSSGAAVAAIPPDNGRIGIFADPLGTERCAAIPAGSIGTLYLFADLAGATAAGITVTEFRIQVTNPAGYQFFYSPPPAANVVIGNALDLTPDDPRDGTGIDIAFPTCQPGPRVPMGTLAVLNMSGGPTGLLVERRNLPSNLEWPCPLFTRCDIEFTKFCMGPCAVDPFGGAVAFRAAINDPACAGPDACPAACAEPPCVDVAVNAPRSACVGEPVTLDVTATNCSAVVDDLTIFIDYQAVAAYGGVAPGTSVSGSRTFPMPDCGSRSAHEFAVGAVAIVEGCPQLFGSERFASVGCDPRLCGGNAPPDCSGARASVEQLWPANGALVPVSVQGVVDREGGVGVAISGVLSDEPPGLLGRRDCPDAFFAGPNAVRLRAERDGSGNGRVYTLLYVAHDSLGLSCNGSVKVCVPRNQRQPCVDDRPLYDALGCSSGAGGGRTTEIQVVPEPGAGAQVAFALEVESAVRLEVYDVRGRLVRTVVEGRYPTGPHALRWDGRDASGRSAAAGIYLFLLQVGDEVRIAKGVLLR